MLKYICEHTFISQSSPRIQKKPQIKTRLLELTSGGVNSALLYSHSFPQQNNIISHAWGNVSGSLIFHITYVYFFISI